MTRYRTIVADPPWAYDAFITTKPTGRDVRLGVGGRVEKRLPYASLTLTEIADLPVRDLADSAGCRCFLWTTNRYLRDAFDILAGWGFKYGQTIVWNKRGANPFPMNVAPNSAEYMLVGNIGSPGRMQAWKSSVIDAGVPKHHSRKPELFLDLVEQVSPGPYLEMFARRNRLGWDTWGNESLEHVEMEPAS